MVVAGSFMTFAGVVAYKYFFFKVHVVCIVLWGHILHCVGLRLSELQIPT